MGGRYDNRFAESLLLQEAYIEGKVWFVNLRVGKKEEYTGINTNPLSSGDILRSANARPMPKIVLSTNDYIDVPYTKGYLQFKAHYEDGWFEQQRHVKTPYLHYKHLYGKIGGDFWINGYYGFRHAAQWGGKHPRYGKLPVSLEKYKRIVFAQSGTEETTPIQGEIINRVGNHLGSRDMGIEFNKPQYTAKIYWQTIFDDGSGKAWRNIRDGLWGISWQSTDSSSLISGITAEYLNTTDQSGHLHDVEHPEFDILGGDDNYFNHYVYNSGWSYKGFGIGHPLLTSPVYAIHYSLNEKNEAWYFPNTKVRAFHLGLSGQIEQFQYRFLATYSLNYGVNEPMKYFNEDTEPDKLQDVLNDYKEKDFNQLGDVYYELPALKQFSTMVEVSFPFRFLDISMDATTRVALDAGEWLGNSFGVYFSLSKSGRLF